MPVFKVGTKYFIEHWYDFVSADNEMGSMVGSDDFQYLIEFSDDSEYMLYSNFKVKITKVYHRRLWNWTSTDV